MHDSGENSWRREQTESQRGGTKPPSHFIGYIGNPEIKFVCCYCSKRLTLPEPAYPHLNASICSDCVRANPCRLVAEANVTNKCFAPWSAEEVESLKSYQHSDLLPYICTKGHVLEPAATGFNCRFCAKFSLDWAYDWTLKKGWM